MLVDHVPTLSRQSQAISDVKFHAESIFSIEGPRKPVFLREKLLERVSETWTWLYIIIRAKCHLFGLLVTLLLKTIILIIPYIKKLYMRSEKYITKLYMRFQKYIKKLYIFSAPSAPINIHSILWYYLLIYNFFIYFSKRIYNFFIYFPDSSECHLYMRIYKKVIYFSLKITLVSEWE